VGGEDGGGPAVPLDHDLVEVVGLGRVQGLQCEVVQDEEIDTEQAPELLLVGGVQSSRLEALQELVGAGEVNPGPGAAGGGAEAAGEHGLADSDRSQDEDADRLLHEAQGAELVPELAVEADRGRVVPELQAHGRVEMSGAGAQIATDAVATGDL